ncbi:MAG: hypothetical protein CVT65_14505 [Actinobacteria bacterium HGW-Actinobacteria-5]|nr:MAG: hypothetical protein CVT65_14505 [Actinobacteria bacterium HGW-Actinobacteria-5]
MSGSTFQYSGRTRTASVISLVSGSRWVAQTLIAPNIRSSSDQIVRPRTGIPVAVDWSHLGSGTRTSSSGLPVPASLNMANG